MAAEVIEYVTKISGQQQVAAGFQQIANAQKQSASAADQLSERLKATTRIAEVEARAAARAAEPFANALGSVSAAAKTAGTDLHALGGIANRGVIAFHSLERGLVPIIVEFGQLTTKLGEFGPIGLAVGVAATAAAAAWEAFGDSNDVAREQAEKFNITLEDQLKLIQKIDKAASEKSLLSQGLAGTEKQFAEVQRLEAERDRITGALLRLTNDDRLTQGSLAANPADERRFGALQRQLAQKNADIAKARALYTQSISEDVPTPDEDAYDAALKRQQDREAKQRATATKKKPFDIYGEHQQILIDIEAAQKDIDNFKSGVAEEEKRKAKERSDALDALRKLELDNDKAYREQHAKDLAEISRRQLEEEKRNTAIRVGLAKQAYSAIASTIAASLSAAVTGAHVSEKEVLHSIGVQSANMGFLNLLQAPVDVFWNPAKAAAEFAAGAAEVAFGAALGSATAGGGSSGGGGGRGSFQRTGAPASPVPFNVSNGQVNGASAQPINVNVQVFGKPDADLGELVTRSVKKAQQQGRV